MNRFVCLIFLPLLTACGPGPLVMNKHEIKGRTAHYEVYNTDLGFSELTFGQALAQSAARSLASPAQQATMPVGHQPSPIESAKQKILKRYFPSERVFMGLQQTLARELNWRASGSNADYNIRLLNSEWGIRHHPIKLTMYSIYYSASLDINDTRIAPGQKSGKGAYFSCSYASDADHSYDEIFANNAAVVESAMDQAVSACIQQFSDKIRARIAKDSSQ